MKNSTRKTEEALLWIVALLRKQRIPFQMTGGFAANIYGSNRPLADIDIDVPDKNILELQQLVKKFAIFGPRRYKDKEFDLLLMTLKYKGQEIDICGSDSQKLFNKKAEEWLSEKIDLSKAKKKKVYHLMVPVIPLKALINYKKKIARVVDIHDVDALSE